jgi:hypothetical protein
MLLCQQVFAMWAAHLVISPASLAPGAQEPKGGRFTAEAAKLARGVTVQPAADGRVCIVLKGSEQQGETGKAYYLMVSKKRLPSDALQLRSALRSTHQGFEGRGGGKRKTTPEGFAEVRPLQPVQRNGESMIEVVLDRATALRSYVVWDFRAIYEKGAMITDGGLWLTYDLPAFVEGAAASKERPEESKGK